MIKVTIEGKTAAEIKEQVVELSKVFGIYSSPLVNEETLSTNTAGTNDENASQIELPLEEVKQEKQPKKKKVKAPEVVVEAPVEAAQAQPVVVDECTPPAADFTLDKAGVTAAAQAVIDSKGINQAREVLKQFGAERLGNITADKYADFINVCKQVLS